MALTDSEIEEFRTLYERNFPDKLDMGEAREIAERMVRLYRLLIRFVLKKNG